MKACDCEAILYDDGSIVVRPPLHLKPFRRKTWYRNSLNGIIQFRLINYDGTVRVQFLSKKTGQVFAYFVDERWV